MSDELLYFNGIDGDNGTYDLPPMSAEDLMRVIRGRRPRRTSMSCASACSRPP